MTLIGEPMAWLVVFNTETTCRLCSWLALGRFKHVRVIGCVGDAWLFYDVKLWRTEILVLSGEAAAGMLASWFVRAEVLRVPHHPERRLWRPRPLLCTSAIAHLLGIRGALRPDAFYRSCLSAGGRPVENPYGHAILPAAGDRPADPAAATAIREAGA